MSALPRHYAGPSASEPESHPPACRAAFGQEGGGRAPSRFKQPALCRAARAVTGGLCRAVAKLPLCLPLPLGLAAGAPGRRAAPSASSAAVGLASGLLLVMLIAPKAEAAEQCVTDAKWSTVAGYYDKNKDNANGKYPYGSNWYRVLIAYRQEDPERTLPAWAGQTAAPTTAFTVKEAEDGEKVWSGWTPVRKVLQCLADAQQTTVEPDPPQPQQGSQDQQVTTYNVNISVPSSVTEGDGGTQKRIDFWVNTGGKIPHQTKYLIKGSTTAGTARPTNWSGGPVNPDGTANPNWDYAFQQGKFNEGIVVTIEANTAGNHGFNISIHGDDTYEGDETIGFDISCHAGCGGGTGDSYEVVIADVEPTVIKDNDPKPMFTISASNVTEGSPIKVKITADRPAQAAYDMKLIIVDDISRRTPAKKAVEDETKTITMPAYQTEVSLDIPTIEHSDIEHRHVNLTLQIPDFHGKTAVALRPVTVEDKLDVYVVTVTTPKTVTEGDGTENKVFQSTIRLDRALGQDLTLTVRRRNSAAKGVSLYCVPGNVRLPQSDSDNASWDYGFCGNVNDYKVTIPAMALSKTFDIIIHEDDTYEANELISFEVTCDIVSGNTNGCGDSLYKVNVDLQNSGFAAVIINDDPKPVVSFEPHSDADHIVTEGEDVSVTINADRPAQAPYDVILDAHPTHEPRTKQERRKLIAIAPYATTATYTESTTNDEAYKQDRFDFHLIASNDYTITPNRLLSSRLVTVLDTIKPIVSTSAKASPIHEGENLVVVVSADKSHQLDYEVNLELVKNSGPEDILDFGFIESGRTVTMKAWTTKTETTYQTRDNNRRDGDINAYARITNARNNSWWEKGREQSFTITDSRESNIPLIGFQSRTNGQGKLYVCANTTNTARFDEGAEDDDDFECNLSIKGPESPKFTLKYELVFPYSDLHQQGGVYPYPNRVNKKDVGIDLDSNPSRFPLVLTSTALAEQGFIDQGDSYPVTIRLLPSDQYDLTDFDTTYIQLDNKENFYNNSNPNNKVSSVTFRVYDSGEKGYYDRLAADLDDLLGEILEIKAQVEITYHKGASLIICPTPLQGNVEDLFDSEDLNDDKTCLKQQAKFLPFQKTAYIAVPLRSTRFDRKVTYDQVTGKSSNLLRVQVLIVCPDDHPGTCSTDGGSADITYIISPPPPPPLDPDDPNYVANPHEYTAKQCVEKNIPKGMVCGEGGRQFLIEYAHDPDTPQDENELDFYVYATPARDEDQNILAEWTEKSLDDGNIINVKKSWPFTIPAKGAVIRLPFDKGNKPQWDGMLNVTFRASDSIYQVIGDNKDHAIKVKNNDKMRWYWTENTLGNTDEGGFTKIGKLSMVKNHEMVIPNGADWELDFNVSGCALQDTDPFLNKDPSSSGDIPCFVRVTSPAMQRVGSELDKFQGTGFPKNGWSFELSVGQDDDMDNETITLDPEFSFLSVQVPERGQGGNCDRDSPDYNKQCLGNFIAYDDDVANYRVTSTGHDMCVSFTISPYTVVESNGPAQPVLRLHEYDATEPDVGKRCKDGENGTASTSANTDHLEYTAAVSVEVTHGTTDDADITFSSPIKVLFPSKAPVTAKFDVHTTGNDGYEGDEYFEATITSVANGLHIGNRSTAKVILLDTPSDITDVAVVETVCNPPNWAHGTHYSTRALVRYPANGRKYYRRLNDGSDANRPEQKPDANKTDWEADSTLNRHCMQVVTVEAPTTEFYESDLNGGWLTFALRLTTTRDWDLRDIPDGHGPLILQPRNGKGLYTIDVDDGQGGTETRNRGRVRESALIPFNRPLIKAKVPTEVTYRIQVWSQHNNQSEDYPDGSFYFESVKQPYYDSLTFRNNRIWLRDGIEDGDRKDLTFRAAKATSGNFKDNHDDNLFHIGTSDRDLMDWETVEIPLEVRDADLNAFPTDDYALELVSGQGNVRLKQLADGTYTFRLTGKSDIRDGSGIGDSEAGKPEVSTEAFTCGTESISTSRAGCLRYVNKRKGVNGLETRYEVNVGPMHTASSGKYGETRNVTYKVLAGTDGYFSTNVDPASSPVNARRTVKIVPIGETAITEPASNGETGMSASRVDVPFDVQIEPRLNDGEHVVVEFCMDEGSTASYYADYRIMDWGDGYHGVASGGLPYDQSVKCTKTRARLYDEKTRFYFRAHGDGHNEGSEKAVMYIKIVEDATGSVSWPGESADVTWTINDMGYVPKSASTSKRAKHSPSAAPEPAAATSGVGVNGETVLTAAPDGDAYWSFRQSWYEGGTHFWDGEGFDEGGIRTALYAMLEINLVTAHDPGLDVPYGEADRGVCLDPKEVPSRLEFEGFALRPLKWRDAPDPHLCRSFRDFENSGSWLADDGLLMNEWVMHSRLGILDDDEINGDEETPAGFPFLLDNPAFPVDVEGGSLDMDTFIIEDDDAP